MKGRIRKCPRSPAFGNRPSSTRGGRGQWGWGPRDHARHCAGELVAGVDVVAFNAQMLDALLEPVVSNPKVMSFEVSPAAITTS